MTSSDPDHAAAVVASGAASSVSNGYAHPLSGRYASREMQHIFSQTRKFTTWRQLWIALAESQRELGLDISGSASPDAGRGRPPGPWTGPRSWNAGSATT